MSCLPHAKPDDASARTANPAAVPLLGLTAMAAPYAGCQKVAVLLSYPRNEESTRSSKLYKFIAHRDSTNRTNVL